MDGSHWQNTAPRVLPGYTFDGQPYQITLSSDEPFGLGGSAVIHKGKLWGAQPLVVAVKMFHDHGAIPKEVREQLLYRELRAARQVYMRHPSILAYLGTAYDGRHEAIVSLYMKNGNLLQYLKANPRSDKKKLILQVAEGVNYLHSVEHLVHGDLKCDNILVSDYGNALLADFGLSRFLELVQSVQATMTSIRRMNTVRFAAPELLVSEEDTRHAAWESRESDKPPPKTYESDVYAFGMLVLEAITEERPWSDALKNIPRRVHEMAVMDRVLKGSHPPQPTWPSGFVETSHIWWDVLKRCWSNDPGRRPRMSFVLDALTHTSLAPCESLSIAVRTQLTGPQDRILQGHDAWVWSVAYLPGGHRVVSTSFDDTIRIWDTLTGRTVIGPLHGHDGVVYSVAVSPNGTQICSGSADRTIRRWDAESGARIGKPMAGHGGGVDSVAFSPDGTRIVSCSADKTVRLWDATTGDAVGKPLIGHTDWVRSVGFSPDGACIASGSLDGTVRLWDSTTGADVGVLKHRGTAVHADPYESWNISMRQLARNVKAHSDWIRSVAVSPSGRYIASGSFDESIRIWDAQTGDAVGARLTGHTDFIHSVGFSPDGRSLVSGSEDNTVCIWNIFE